MDYIMVLLNNNQAVLRFGTRRIPPLAGQVPPSFSS